MSKKTMSKQTPIATAIGAAFVAGMAAAPMASAAENPFAFTALSSGYQVADNQAAKPVSKPAEGKCGGAAKMKDGKCGEGKCGGAAKMKDGKCGEGKCGGAAKMKDGKCGEGKCGGAAKMKDGKCGEGKCGGAKAQGSAKKTEPGKTSTEKQ